MIRNDWRQGDYLIKDEESGLVHYRSQMRKNWDGSWRHKDNVEPIQPQLFVKAKSDPKTLKRIRPDSVYPAPENFIPLVVGQSTIITRTDGPAAHLFATGVLGGDFGIGDMIIEASVDSAPFIVR